MVHPGRSPPKYNSKVFLSLLAYTSKDEKCCHICVGCCHVSVRGKARRGSDCDCVCSLIVINTYDCPCYKHLDVCQWMYVLSNYIGWIHILVKHFLSKSLNSWIRSHNSITCKQRRWHDTLDSQFLKWQPWLFLLEILSIFFMDNFIKAIGMLTSCIQIWDQ